MLINIGLNDYKLELDGLREFDSVIGLEVTPADPVISQLLKQVSLLAPTQTSVSHTGLAITDRVITIMELRAKENIERKKKLDEWLKMYEELPDEEKEFYANEKYVRVFPEGMKTAPNLLESYGGAFINNDVPHYMVYELVSALRAAAINVYFAHAKPIFKEVLGEQINGSDSQIPAYKNISQQVGFEPKRIALVYKSFQNIE